MIVEFLENITLNHWTWFITGLVLLGLEVMAPGVIFLWLAIAAGIIGTVVFILPDMTWEMQLLIFSILSVISVVLGRRYLKLKPIESDDETLNKRGGQYIGSTYILEKPLLNGEGKVRVGDSLWLVEGDFTAERGESVKVVAQKGTVLLVEKI